MTKVAPEKMQPFFISCSLHFSNSSIKILAKSKPDPYATIFSRSIFNKIRHMTSSIIFRIGEKIFSSIAKFYLCCALHF